MSFTGQGQVASLELKLRSLESRLSSLERAQNPQASAPFVRGPLPSVESLTVEQTVGSLYITFDPVNLSTLKYYEIQYSSTSEFSFPDTLTTNHTALVISPGVGVGATTYYVRVRVVDTSDRIGPWSVTVDETPGQAATADVANLAVSSAKLATGAATTAKIDTNATSEVSQFTQSSGFTTLNTDLETETYGPVSATTVDANTFVCVSVALQFNVSTSFPVSGDTNRFTLELLRRPSGGADTVINTYPIDFEFDIPTGGVGTATFGLPAFFVENNPGSAGTFEFRARLTVDISGSATISFTGESLTLQAVARKR